VKGLFAGTKSTRNIRYALLAGTMMLPPFAVPQASMAADSASAQLRESAIVLAQVPAQAPAIDPQAGKPLPEGPPPKGAQPQPKGSQSAQPPAAAGGRRQARHRRSPACTPSNPSPQIPRSHVRRFEIHIVPETTTLCSCVVL
jgi:hypothetical protein